MIDRNTLDHYLGYQPFECETLVNPVELEFSEPYGTDITGSSYPDTCIATDRVFARDKPAPQESNSPATSPEVLKGNVLRLGDFIDTDAVHLTSGESFNSRVLDY